MIRPASEEDADAIARIYAPYVEETWISFEDRAPNAAEMRARMRDGMGEHPWLVAADEGGGVLGYAYASKHRARAAYRWSADVSVYVDRAQHRQGIGARLYKRLLEILRRQHFRACYAGIALPNAASVGLHERMGFAHVGIYRDVGFKLGAWRDVGWWALTLAEGGAALPEPLAYAQLRCASRLDP